MKSLLVYILGSALVGFAIAQMECLQELTEDKIKEVEDSLNDHNADELALLCPLFSNYFNCLEENLGMPLRTFALNTSNDEVQRYFTLLSNIKDTVKDLCEDGNSLNTQYKQHALCFKMYGISEPDVCTGEAETAYDAYKVHQLLAGVEIGSPGITNNRHCFQSAYTVACVLEMVQQVCGSGATDLAITLIKRTTIIRNTICTSEDIVELKTGFLDSLNLEGTKRDLFQNAFDL